jgi:hypothetical protein
VSASVSYAVSRWCSFVECCTQRLQFAQLAVAPHTQGALELSISSRTRAVLAAAAAAAAGSLAQARQQSQRQQGQHRLHASRHRRLAGMGVHGVGCGWGEGCLDPCTHVRPSGLQLATHKAHCWLLWQFGLYHSTPISCAVSECWQSRWEAFGAHTTWFCSNSTRYWCLQQHTTGSGCWWCKAGLLGDSLCRVFVVNCLRPCIDWQAIGQAFAKAA